VLLVLSLLYLLWTYVVLYKTFFILIDSWPEWILCPFKISSNSLQALTFYRVINGETYPEKRELHNTTEYPLIYVVFQNTNFFVVFCMSYFKLENPGTQWYCLISNIRWFAWFIFWLLWLLSKYLRKSRFISSLYRTSIFNTTVHVLTYLLLQILFR